MIALTTFRVDGPVGPLLGAVTETGLAVLSFGDVGYTRDVARFSESVSVKRNDHHAIAQTLRGYLDGSVRSFDVPVDLRLATPFARRVLTALCDVPFGGLVTYGELARAAGSPGGARAVGGAVGANPVSIVVP